MIEKILKSCVKVVSDPSWLSLAFSWTRNGSVKVTEGTFLGMVLPPCVAKVPRSPFVPHLLRNVVQGGSLQQWTYDRTLGKFHPHRNGDHADGREEDIVANG